MRPTGPRQQLRAAFALSALLGCALACAPDRTAPDPRPNLLWVVWDTVRADRLSLYGHHRPTTPFLEEWARDARVFDDCLSVAPYTIPSHASMFTGLMPSEHDVDRGLGWFLDDRYATIAELLLRSGYQTYLYAANPHISREGNFHRGFEVEEHPWDPANLDDAVATVRARLEPGDSSAEIFDALASPERHRWAIKSSGELARRGLERWLARRDPERPFFAFLNYMEAHRPFLPTRTSRARMMDAAQLRRSYEIDQSWETMFAYVFGLHEYSDEDLEVMAATYDATLLDLDGLFRDLLYMLRKHVDLDRTIVVLTSDHGEHLGEHHLLNHHYSVYDPLLRVPLVIRYPGRFAPGRDDRPAMNIDLFPTLLEAAGVEAPAGLRSQALHLDRVGRTRTRLAELPSPFGTGLQQVQARHPGFDPTPWTRVLRALHADGYKYIWASDGRHELYRHPEDRLERHDLFEARRDLAGNMDRRLADFVARLTPPGGAQSVPAPSRETRAQLEALGYLAPGQQEAAGGSTRPRLPMPPRPASP